MNVSPQRRRNRVWTALGILASCLLAQSAQAQSPRQSEPRYQDAHADRVVIAPTAETHPEGTLYGSLYDIVVPQLGFAPTERVQVTLTGFSDFSADRNFFVEATLKANLLRTRRLRVAALTAIDALRGNGETLVFGRVGGTFQWCLAEACQGSLNVSAMAVIHDKTDIIFPFGFAMGLVAPITHVTKLLLEYGTLSSLSDGIPLGELPLWYAGYGLRFSEDNWGLDLTFIRVLARVFPERRQQGPDLLEFLGVPLFVFTYRLGHR